MPQYGYSSDTTDGTSEGTGIFILPESALGTLAELGACIGKCILYKQKLTNTSELLAAPAVSISN